MRYIRGTVLSGLLLVGLGSCSETSVPEVDQSFLLTAVLPSSAVPGQTVTLYGRLPETALHIQLDSASYDYKASGSKVRDGLQFTLPENMNAGLYEVSLDELPTQKVMLDVRPRLDDLVLNGSSLTVRGAGWTTAHEVTIEVNGQLLSAQGAPGILSTVIGNINEQGPAGELYGALNVRVLVGERASEMKTIRKEALTIRGRVHSPLSTHQIQVQSAVASEVKPVRSLLACRNQLSRITISPVHHETLPGTDYVRLTFASVKQAQQALAQFEPGFAEYDQPLTLQDRPGKLEAQALAAEQWQWPLLGVTEAWKTTQGTNVTVAIIDSGVMLQHPELKDNLLPGYNVLDPQLPPTDESGHGTHVAGIVAAHGELRGAAPEARVVPIKVIAPNRGTVGDLTTALLWAANLLPDHPNPHPAQIINMSLGTPQYSDILVETVQKVLDQGILIVAASGNDGGLPYAPANIPGVISVTSVSGPVTTYQPSYANRGPNLSMTAYGGDLRVDQDSNGHKDGILSADMNAAGEPIYAYRQGTSMAAPQVTGIAALMLARGVPPTQVQSLLEGQATDLGVQGRDFETGYGLVNARAIQGDVGTYVVALDSQGRPITYVRPHNGAFQLQNLPPNQLVTILSGTDRDQDGVIGEAGELLGVPQELILNTDSPEINLQLQPSDGQHSFTLPK